MNTTIYVTRLPQTACENDDHTFAGLCTEECAWIISTMMDPGPDDRIYSDYLGGTSSVDVSGCHRGPERPEEEVGFDPVNRAVVLVEVHPEYCECPTHEED